jgi:small subunit ribosomal protein S21
MNGIVVRESENFERALRRFSKTCERSGVLSDIKKFRHFEKPSAERKRKLNAAKRKRMREERRSSFGVGR